MTQYDASGAEFNMHEFTYYDDIRDSTGHVPGVQPGAVDRRRATASARPRST